MIQKQVEELKQVLCSDCDFNITGKCTLDTKCSAAHEAEKISNWLNEAGYVQIQAGEDGLIDKRMIRVKPISSDSYYDIDITAELESQKALDDEKWIEKYNKLQNHTKELEAINEAHRKLNGELQTKLEQEHLKCQAYSDKSDYLENFVKDFMPYSL